MERGLGVAGSDVVHSDLDDLIGTWKADEEFDRVIEEQDTVDTDKWQ